MCSATPALSPAESVAHSERTLDASWAGGEGEQRGRVWVRLRLQAHARVGWLRVGGWLVRLHVARGAGGRSGHSLPTQHNTQTHTPQVGRTMLAPKKLTLGSLLPSRVVAHAHASRVAWTLCRNAFAAAWSLLGESATRAASSYLLCMAALGQGGKHRLSLAGSSGRWSSAYGAC